MISIAALLFTGRTPKDQVADLSRVDALSERERSAIPDTDFVSSRFDREAAAPPTRMIVLLSTPRSGSTYLCHLMHQVGLGTAHEYFQRDQYLPILADRWGCIDDGHVSWSRYAAALEHHRTSDQGVLVINLHGSHLRRYLEALPHFSAKDIRYVWLQRQDKLRQAVSFGIAKQTGQWSSAFRRNNEPVYRARHFRDRLRMIHQQEDAIRSFLHLMAVSNDAIYYEDLVLEPASLLHQLFGVTLKESEAIGDQGLQRQGTATNEEFVRRLATDILPQVAPPLSVAALCFGKLIIDAVIRTGVQIPSYQLTL